MSDQPNVYRPIERVCGVYFIACGDYIKIGVSADVPSRLIDLQRSNPYACHVLGMVKVPFVTAVNLEKVLHRHFHSQRHRYEWFHDCEEIRAYIQKHAVQISQAEERDPLEGLRP
jgi:hypothetical protein